MVLLGERGGRATEGFRPPAAEEEWVTAAKKRLRRELKVGTQRVGKFVGV